MPINDTFFYSNIFLFIGLLLFFGVIITKPSQRYGIPALILYIGLGFFIGNGGQYDFIFNFPVQVSLYSQFAIGFIVFIGGFATPLGKMKNVWIESITLSTAGVLLTTSFVAFFCFYFLNLSMASGLLIGTVLSATDAAAVFSILESKKMRLKENISEVLEVESSTNDPMAYFLTVLFASIVAGEKALGIQVGIIFLQQTFFGILLGSLTAYFLILVLKKISLEVKGLYPIIVLSLFLIILGLSQYIGANSLIALYVAGLVVGNGSQEAKDHATDFFEGFSWLMQISLFIVLGLQANPTRIIESVTTALPVSLFLMFLARPLAVFLCYLLSSSSLNKRVFISWMGLRGATPIAFALIPMTYGLSIGAFVFDVAFLVVIFSVIIQGTTIEWLAHKLNLIEKV